MTTPSRAEAAAALLQALRDVADANERLQLAAAWTLEAFGDQPDAETVRMLRVPGGTPRPGRPPVPVVNREQADRARLVQEPSVTGDERCWCGHLEVDHSDTACQVGSCQCGGFDDEGIRR